MESLTAVFGKRVKTIRKQRGLTQEELGRRARVDYKYLGALERGERTPSFPVIERLAKALDAEYHQFFIADDAAVAQLEKSLQSALKGMSRLARPELEDFFREMLFAVKKLDTRLAK